MRSLNTIIEGMFDVDDIVDDASRELEAAEYIKPCYTNKKISISVDNNVATTTGPRGAMIQIYPEKLKQLGIDTIISDSSIEYYEENPLIDFNIKAPSFTYYTKGHELVKLQNMNINGYVYFSLYQGNNIEFKNVTINNNSTIKFSGAQKLKFNNCKFESNELIFEDIDSRSELGDGVKRFIAEWLSNSDDPETIQHLYSKPRYSINNIMQIPKNWDVDMISFKTHGMPGWTRLYFMTKKAWSSKSADMKDASVLMTDGWYVCLFSIL